MALRSILQSSGVLDWVIQRVSAVILGFYSVFIVGILLAHPQLDFSTWQALFERPIMKIFSLAALTSVCAHSWIGMWTVTTDYLTPIQLGICLASSTICARDNSDSNLGIFFLGSLYILGMNINGQC